MIKTITTLIFLTLYTTTWGANHFTSDTVKTSTGQIVLTFIGHGTLMVQLDSLVLHIDPVSEYANYDELPKADLILVTHGHGDHLDLAAHAKIQNPHTQVIASSICREKLPAATILENGKTTVFKEASIEAVPAYNIIHKYQGQRPFHPKGEGNGYIIRYHGLAIYIAGDTENTPEMKSLKNIDIAFLPMNLPYTMTPEMVADAAEGFRPRILYPYHYGETDVNKLVELLSKEKGIEIRIRDLK